LTRIPNNLTFTLLASDLSDWRTDLTFRFCEFFSHKFNGDRFRELVTFQKTVDDALNACKTDYLLIQKPGNIPVERAFFEALEKIAGEKHIFVGHIFAPYDYAELEPHCLFVNMKLWREHGRPAFASHDARSGIKFTYVGADYRYPDSIHAVPCKETCFVPGRHVESGAALIMKQLEVFGSAYSFKSFTNDDELFYLDNKTPYHEIHCETIFEKRHLARMRSSVFALDNDDVSAVESKHCHTLIVPAHGLKAYTLVEHYKPKHLVIYADSEEELHLQRLIFASPTTQTYREVMDFYLSVNFQNHGEHPRIVDDWEADEFAVIKPIPNLVVEFKLVDVFSFQIEELIQSIEIEKDLTIDFSDIFVYPYNYYKRSFAQVQGLFDQVYSLLKSRKATSNIIGYAPGFTRCEIDVVDIPAPAGAVQISADLNVYSSSVISEEFLREISAVPVPKELVEKVQELVKDVEVKLDEPLAPEPVVAKTPGIIEVASSLGFSLAYEDGGQVTVFTKQHAFDQFTAIFEYRVSANATWILRISEFLSPKKLDFASGKDHVSLEAHMRNPKINPKSLIKYLR
jgi:hypothetical protein